MIMIHTIDVNVKLIVQPHHLIPNKSLPQQYDLC